MSASITANKDLAGQHAPSTATLVAAVTTPANVLYCAHGKLSAVGSSGPAPYSPMVTRFYGAVALSCGRALSISCATCPSLDNTTDRLIAVPNEALRRQKSGNSCTRIQQQQRGTAARHYIAFSVTSAVQACACACACGAHAQVARHRNGPEALNLYECLRSPKRMAHRSVWLEVALKGARCAGITELHDLEGRVASGTWAISSRGNSSELMESMLKCTRTVLIAESAA